MDHLPIANNSGSPACLTLNPNLWASLKGLIEAAQRQPVAKQ